MKQKRMCPDLLADDDGIDLLLVLLVVVTNLVVVVVSHLSMQVDVVM